MGVAPMLHNHIDILMCNRQQNQNYGRRQKIFPPFDPYNGRPFKKKWVANPCPRFLVRASIRTRVLFLSHVLLLEAQQEQASKLCIFLIKLSHSSSTYENTFAFQHFSDRRRAITFSLKEHAILFAYSVRTVLGSSHSSSVTITELSRAFLDKMGTF